jgi:hypothetical protein
VVDRAAVPRGWGSSPPSGTRPWLLLGLTTLVACGGVGLEGKPDPDDIDRFDEAALTTTLPEGCVPLPEAEGQVVRLQPGDDLRAAAASAAVGTTLLLADGLYDLSGGDAVGNLVLGARGVRLRGASGNPDAVVLDARIDTNEIVTITADDVVVAELTIARNFGAGIAVRGAARARVYRVNFLDAGERAVAALPSSGAYADEGVVACVTETRQESCGTGVELRQAAGWTLRDSRFDHPGCDAPGLLAWTGSRGTIVTRSRFVSAGIAVRFGDTEYAEGDERVYADAECPDPTVGHYGGRVEDSFVVGGLRAEEACGAEFRHLSVSSGELAWAFSQGMVARNNLAAVTDGGGSVGVEGNLRPSSEDFIDAGAGDLHLAPGSAARGAGVGIESDDLLDIDGDARSPEAPSVGADEG